MLGTAGSQGAFTLTLAAEKRKDSPGVPGQGRGRRLATGHQMLFPVLGVGACSGGPSRGLVQAHLYN